MVSECSLYTESWISVVALHICTVLSLEPEAMYLPLGDQANASMTSECSS